MSRKPVHAASELDPETPELAPIDTETLKLNLNKWFRKTYELDFSLAHSEIPCVLEEINDALQRFSIAMHDAKKDAEELRGQRFLKLRQEWNATYAEKMTEAALEAVLAQDKDIYDAWHRYAVLKSYVSRLINTMENLRLKLGAMRSSEATRRKLFDDGEND